MNFDPPITMNNTTALPANSQITPVLDTTYWNWAAPWASTATLPGPGKSRGQLAGKRVTGSVLVTTSDATLKVYILTNPSDTANTAWELDTNFDTDGQKTLTAGTTYTFSYLPVTPDYLITLTAGADNPDAVYTTLMLTNDRTSGT